MQRWSTSFYNVISSRVEELGRQFKAGTIKVTTEVVHSGPNGKEYKELLEKSIPDIAENMENSNASYDEIQAALENELNNTRIKLLTGELKINNVKFKTTEKGKK